MRQNPFNFPLFIILLGVILGIIFQDSFFVISYLYSIIFSLVGIVFLFACFYIIKKFQKESIFLLSFIMGVLLYNAHYEPNNKNHYLQKLSPNTEYILSGTIQEIKGKRIIVSLQKEDQFRVKGKVSLQLKDTLSQNIVGKYILCFTSLAPISQAKNPSQFNYKKYMCRQYIYWQGTPLCYQLEENHSHSIVFLAKKTQIQLASSLDKYPFSDSSKAIIKALVLGIRSDIDTDTYQHYIDAGAVHILAISGLHIGLITFILTQIINFIFPFRQKKLKTAIIFTILLGYSFITGLSASVLRSVLMFGGYSMAFYIGNGKARFDSLMFSAFILLLCKPMFLFEVGFQLSYMAVLSIELFLPFFNKYWFYENKLLNLFPSIIKVSIAAQIGIIPLSLYYFHQFAGLFLITNMLILPFLGIILGLGVIVVFLSSIHSLPYWLVVSYDFIIILMNKSIEKIASYRDLIITGVYFNEIMLIVSYIVMLWGVLYLYFRKIRFLYLLLISVLLFQGYLFYQKYEKRKIDQLIVYQQYKKTMISHQQGGEAIFYLSDTISLPRTYIKNFCTQRNIKHFQYKPITNIISFKGKHFVIVDEKFYLDKTDSIDYLLLRNSPKIHLEKFLEKGSVPKIIIADGSNYPYMMEKWEKTCRKYHIPFYNTYKEGYFLLE
ncbi:ComEC/Rec2 family competence protein [Capnocytophaga sp. G2]|uniref:ComEC/Rec2 family competence protein n=1 Tax=Capnocytophaga sp. G2 TaxID=3110695 RepID=UPI002B483C30|nr:ComEC/Rec2 family competence protein [Capnocytophaga sp. G2]MEB3004858.1 ComEC/Rec2 family competence protein [Capnocytophaga sp. G2]